MSTNWGDFAQKQREERAAKEAQIVAAFRETHEGLSPHEYVFRAESEVYADGKAGGTAYEERRSADGKAWTVAPPFAVAPHAHELVVQYHAHEEAAKAAAANGDLKTAIDEIDLATQKRLDYSGGNDDGPHRTALFVLSKRRASISDLNIHLAGDRRIAAATTEVRNFYGRYNLSAPF